MLSRLKKSITWLFWLLAMVCSNAAMAETIDLAANNPPKRNPNQINFNPGIIFPTNYNKPIPEPKQPFVPVIENKMDSSPQTGPAKKEIVKKHKKK